MFLYDILYPVHDIYIVTHQSMNHLIRCRSRFSCFIQKRLGSFFRGHIITVRFNNTESHHCRLTLLRFNGHTQAYQFFYSFQIAQRDQDPILCIAFIYQLFSRHFRQSHILSAFLCYKRSDSTSNQYHYNGSVQHTLVQQPDRFSCR